MNETLPKRTACYTSAAMDSSRWDNFIVRDDDVFICTPAKAGTTWTQTICALLIFGWKDFDIKPSDVSPWYDSKFQSPEEMEKWSARLSHRRFFKTHTALDGIPYFPQCTYVTVYRDPRDAFFSMRNHAANITMKAFDAFANSELAEAFRSWIEKPAVKGGELNFSLAQYVDLFRSYKRFDRLDNIHFFHYSDMKRDLPGAIAGIAAALGITVNADDIEQIARTADFDNMRGNPEQFTPGVKINLWKDNQSFFNKGSNGQWRDAISAEDMALYDARISTLLPADQIAWLHDGNGQ